MAYGGGNYGGFEGQDAYGANGNSNGGYGSQRDQGGGNQEPNGRVVLNGYREEISSGFEGGKPRYNPMNPSRPQSSMLLNVNDPIQVHLLVETALGDSKEYEILSQEEVDDLKKQIQYLTSRIEQTRQNLAIQSKYRDAAISMSKLYSPNDKKDDSKRRSFFGHNRNPSDSADQERIASERKCEELAAELFSLEKRMMEPQSRLLKHTAGILQMTHKGPTTKNAKSQSGIQQSGMPGSPESMYTYSNARASMEPIHDEMFFDDRSLYKSFAGLDDFEGLTVGSKGGKEQMQMIAKTEAKLADLNSRLREYIINANPEGGASYNKPPVSKQNDVSAETLQGHLEYLERGIDAMDQASSQQNQGAGMEEALEELNREVMGLLLPYDPNRKEPPRPTGNGPDQQLIYFQESISAMEYQLSAGAKSGGNQEQMEAVMNGLWDIIKSGEDGERQRKQERRKQRSAQNLPPDEDESADEDASPSESFSVQAFSAKVQWLYSQATRLKDQKKVLQRQIKQQRELNNKSDEQKDAELTQKSEELSRTQGLLTRTENDADEVRNQLSQVMDQLDASRQSEATRSGDSSALQAVQADLQAVQAELQSKDDSIASLEEELQDLQDDHAISNAETATKMAALQNQITTLTASIATFDSTAKSHTKEISKREQEMEEANIEIANLRTEVTIARAELDGAYGSRAQRAAEVASNPAIQKEIDDLNQRNITLLSEIESLKVNSTQGSSSGEVSILKKELEETIGEFEVMTKASIEWEKEREKLEANIDKMRDERESLESQLSDERVRWLGMRSPGAEGGSASIGAGATSTSVLKNEFKKMMRDTRAENAKVLRAEQSERRKLEDEIRSLKKAQGPGKSGLSQSIGA